MADDDATWLCAGDFVYDVVMIHLAESCFERCFERNALVPVWNLTPRLRGCFHRFFDTWPISPSGRYLAVLQMPDEFRLNRPGESAAVVLVDLHTGEHRIVAQTCGWEVQMGANINWGKDDHTLVFNDVDTQTWTPMLVRLDPLRGGCEKIPGGVYHVSPDGRYAASASLHKMRRTQNGYGVLLPDEHVPINAGVKDDDGLYLTDLETGQRKLVLSLAEAAKVIDHWEDRPIDDWNVYGFHSKFSPDGQRLIFTIRRGLADAMAPWHNIGGGKTLRFDVLTCKLDGSDVHNAVPAPRWLHRGHHINWFPDSESLSMNLGGFGDSLRFVRVRYDGHGLGPILEHVRGTGHPTVHPSGHILTDTYHHETPYAHEDGTTPLRWVDMKTAAEREVVRFSSSVQPMNDGALRVDPHPAWDPGNRWVVFNAVQDNSRTVMLADMARLVDGG